MRSSRWLSVGTGNGQAMLKLMNGEGNPVFAHPAFWALFVGEGGASQ